MTTRDRTEALLHIATAAAANYRREKQERGLLGQCIYFCNRLSHRFGYIRVCGFVETDVTVAYLNEEQLARFRYFLAGDG